MRKEPLISCICLSYKRPGFLQKAIRCFNAQTYPHKELIVIGHEDDVATAQIIDSCKADDVKLFIAPFISRGNLRNLAIECSEGDYFCQWDDDDWYHPDRLSTQLSQTVISNKPASVVAYRLMYDKVQSRAYFSFPFMWPQTLLCSRTVYELGITYEDLTKNEDEQLVMRLHLLNYVCPVVTPYLYTYIYHGANTHRRNHFDKLFSLSQPLSSAATRVVTTAVMEESREDLLTSPALLSELNYFTYSGTPYNGNEEEPDTFFFEQLSSKVVQNGPFEGLKYPDFKAAGSSLFPKLIGCYEYELAAIINEMIDKRYANILNIGCAEGYYANGMALRCKNSIVHAYDSDEQARAICSEMAVLNGVANRVHVHSECTPPMLQEFDFSAGGLIICDCEGFEDELFNEKNVSNLHRCDLLIETHDFVNVNISTRLSRLFNATHDVTVIKSVDDIQKAKTYSFPPFQDLTDLNDKKFIYAEHRPCIMEWLWLKSRSL